MVIEVVVNNKIARVGGNCNCHHQIGTNDSGSCHCIGSGDNDNDNNNCHMLWVTMAKVMMVDDKWKWIVKKLDLEFLAISSINI